MYSEQRSNETINRTGSFRSNRWWNLNPRSSLVIMMEGSRSATVIFTIVDSQVQVKCENDQLAGMREWICIKRQQIEAYHGKANAVPSPWTRWAKRRENNAKTGRKSINCVLHGHQRLLSEPESIIRITMVLISRINQLQINLLIHVPGAVRRLTFVSTSFPRRFHVVSTLFPRWFHGSRAFRIARFSPS